MTATVLIVDDSTFIVEGLVALLRKQYRVLTSGGGRECLSVLATEKPDVIVLDILMEPMDGWETLSRIKADPATRFIPVLLFSAKKITPGEAEVCHDQVARFLLKPVNPRALVAEIEAILAREDRHRRLQADWAQAGVPRQQIEDYLTASSNLDADRSLLAVLKKQAGQFVAEKALSSELADAIAALEERIAREQEVVSGFPGRNGLPSPGLLPCPEACAHAGPEPISPPVPELPAVAMPDPVQGPAPEAGDAGEAPAMTDEAPRLVRPEGGSPFVPLAPEEEPEAVPDRDAWGTVELAADEDAGAAGKDPDPEPAIIPAAEPVPDGAPGDPGSASWIHIPAHAGVPETVYSSGIEEFLEDEQTPAPPAAASPQDSAPLPAACPVPVLSASESRQETIRDPLQDPVHPAAPRQPAGFFSRIIAIIAGIFGRGRC